MKKIILRILTVTVIVLFVLAAQRLFEKYKNENRILNQVIERLSADSRAAEILVTSVSYDEKQRRVLTTIKFLEYGIDGNPLEPKYFTFIGNIIQFQSLVIRFDDIHIRGASKLKDKSVYLFWKVFMLDGANTQEFVITEANMIPSGYKIRGQEDGFEGELWEKFWDYALKPQEAKKTGIKNAQIEAPGTMFMPGILYTIKIEHDGGLRIDSKSLPDILRGEKIPN
ncbi:MAG: hypothetical protein ABH872_05415 [Candidatus Omnitrophota bacterium]